MPVPFLGRLNPAEYIALVGSFFLVGLEAIIRVLTLALPTSLLLLFYRASSRLFNRFASPAQKRAEERKKTISTSIRNASDFVDLCALFGYSAEEHVLQTKDGFLLGLHRLAWRKGEEDIKVNSGPKSLKKRVVYLHHGLLMNSEVWVCLTEAERCLPFVLVERGFDVWLGNNRGNKYSKKCVKCGPNSLEFWNFSMDEFAFHDIPDSIAYVLESTGQPSLSYIGFSQGTAQAFAALAIHPKLNDQINVFIALAPAMSPAGLHNGVVDALVKASPQVLFLLFGRRSILSSATMWQSILYPPIFCKVIDIGLSFLFNWRTKNISTSQKLAAYPHLYSFTSTKSVVHWFQIIRNKSFQMFDDDVHPPISLRSSSKYTKVAKYPTRNIKTPTVLVYGGVDSLVDIKVMLQELPPTTVATEIPHYEHLDFLWARDVDSQVFPHVFDALESFTGAEHSREQYERYRSARHTSLSAQLSFRHASRSSDVHDSDVADAVAELTNGIRRSQERGSGGGARENEAAKETEKSAHGSGAVAFASGHHPHPHDLHHRPVHYPAAHIARENDADLKPARLLVVPQQQLGTTDEETSDLESPAPASLSLQSTRQSMTAPTATTAPTPPPPATASQTPTTAAAGGSSALTNPTPEPHDEPDATPSTPARAGTAAARPHSVSTIDGAGDSPTTVTTPTAAKLMKGAGFGVRRGSAGSLLSLDSLRDGGRGISLGAAKPVGGVITVAEAAAAATPGSSGSAAASPAPSPVTTPGREAGSATPPPQEDGRNGSGKRRARKVGV